MPVLDGIEATRRLRASVPEARVVILTMHGEEAVIDRALRAGAAAYLLKDCSMDEVAATLRAVAAGDTDLSAELARSMLAELPGPEQAAADAPAPVLSQREAEVLQLFADGCSTVEVGPAALHQRQDREEPPGLDLREARRSGPHPGRPHGGANGDHPPELNGRRPANESIGLCSRTRRAADTEIIEAQAGADSRKASAPRRPP